MEALNRSILSVSIANKSFAQKVGTSERREGRPRNPRGKTIAALGSWHCMRPTSPSEQPVCLYINPFQNRYRLHIDRCPKS